MASLSSSAHFCSSSTVYSNSSFVRFHHRHYISNLEFSAISPKILGSENMSLQSNGSPYSNAILMQDGVVATTTATVENEAPTKKLKDVLLSASPPEEHKEPIGFEENNDKSTVSITVVGASGDLAKKKIFPALFALYYEDCLPEHFTIFGYARSKMTGAELRNMVSKTLTCRIDKRENCGEKMEQFLKRCFYHSGHYDSKENSVKPDKKLKEHEAGRVSNRLFYLSIPPNIFIDAVRCASISASSSNGWMRVIVEKPFGRDSESSAALTRYLKQYLEEDQIFR